MNVKIEMPSMDKLQELNVERALAQESFKKATLEIQKDASFSEIGLDSMGMTRKRFAEHHGVSLSASRRIGTAAVRMAKAELALSEFLKPKKESKGKTKKQRKNK